jgi:hypothetical protein
MTDNEAQEYFARARPALGNKFNTILDSYLYAVVKRGEYDMIQETESGNVYLFCRKILIRIIREASEQGFFESQLALTEAEYELVFLFPNAVLIEDKEGWVDVQWYEESTDAWSYFKEFETAVSFKVDEKSRHARANRLCVSTS